VFQYDLLAMSYLNIQDLPPPEPTNPFIQSRSSQPDSFVMRGAVNRSEGPITSDRGKLKKGEKKQWKPFFCAMSQFIKFNIIFERLEARMLSRQFPLLACAVTFINFLQLQTYGELKDFNQGFSMA